MELGCDFIGALCGSFPVPPTRGKAQLDAACADNALRRSYSLLAEGGIGGFQELYQLLFAKGTQQKIHSFATSVTPLRLHEWETLVGLINMFHSFVSILVKIGTIPPLH